MVPTAGRSASAPAGPVASWPVPPSEARRCPSAATIAAALASVRAYRVECRLIDPSPLSSACWLSASPCSPRAPTAARKGRVTPAGWAVRPAGAEISVARTTQGFQGPLGSALSPSGQKLLTVSSAATRINSTDLFDLRTRRRTGTVAYDSRRGIGEAVFYGVAWSPGRQARVGVGRRAERRPRL